MNSLSYQYINTPQQYDSYSTYSLNQNMFANAEKYIPSNLFQTIYMTIPNIQIQECEFQSQENKNYDVQNPTTLIPTTAPFTTISSQPMNDEYPSDHESLEDEPRKKKGKNKSATQQKIWTKEEEDELILTLGLKYKNDWKRVAKQILKIRGRKLGPKKLKDHFKSLTKGSLPKRIKFTHEEDLLIAKYFEQFGADWAKIATFLPSRSAMMIKNRYYSFIRKKNLVNNLLNEISSSNNQKIETDNSSLSPSKEDSDQSEITEDETPFISYKESNESDSLSKVSMFENFNDQDLENKINFRSFDMRNSYFSDFDNDCYYLFDQSFKNDLFD